MNVVKTLVLPNSYRDSVALMKLSSDLGALPEVVEESGGGFTYRTADELVAALERLRTDPGLRDQLGERGYDAYRRLWSEEPHLRAYFGLLREIADRKELVLPELAEVTTTA